MGEPLRAAFDLRAARAYPQRPFQPRIRVCLAGRSSPPADFPTVRIAHVPTRHPQRLRRHPLWRSEEHTSELQSLMRISYAVFCLKTKKKQQNTQDSTNYVEN